MSNVVFWRQVFLGASLFLCGGYPIIAAEVGDLTPNVGTRNLQQDGRRVFRQSRTNCRGKCPC